jgi:hypothetical protein
VSAAVALRRSEPGSRRRSLFDEVASVEPTLQELLARVWEGLAVTGSAACPVCGEAMEADSGAGGVAAGGRCTACGSTLS